MRTLTATLWLLAVCTLPAFAVVPGTMNFQGVLTDGFGTPVADGDYTVNFAIYSESAGGSARWSESQVVVTSNGLFNVILGAAVPIPDTAVMDTAAYLELQVESDPALTPRTRLTSTAYSVVSSSLIGEGPVHMKLIDPSSGDSSIFDILVTPDSTYESKRQHKPFVILKSIDKASPFQSELSIVSTSGSTDSAKYSRSVSTADGLLETSASASATAQATGKRQHKPIYFSKEWSTTNSSRTLDMSSIFTLDSGYTRNIALNEGDVEVEMQQQMNYPDVLTAKSRPIVFPHILENRKSHDASTGDAATTRLFVDADSGFTRIASVQNGDHHVVSAERLGAPPEGGTAIPDINRFRASVDETSGDSSMCWCHFDADSGYATRIAVQQGDEGMESLDLIGAPPMGAIAIPNLLDARKSGNESAGDTASTWNFVDADSGCGETATVISPDGSTVFSRVARAPQVSVGGGGTTTVFEIGVETNSSTAGSEHVQEVLDLVSGYHKSAGIDQTDLITSNETGTSQTREHVLLSRQVGVSTSTPSSRSLELQTDDGGVSARLKRGDQTDSSGIEMVADDDSTQLVLYTRTSAGRYHNLTLKRGVVGAEMSLGYDFAGSSAMIYAVSSPAAGAQLGINTTSPTEAFHLVGNGCYTGTFGACSDRRYKAHIETLAQPLALVNRLRGVQFDWKRSDFPDQNFPEGEQVGLIAQEVESVVPSVVHTGADGYKSVDYAKLVPLLIEGMKAQEKHIAELEARLKALEGTRTIGQR